MIRHAVRKFSYSTSDGGMCDGVGVGERGRFVISKVKTVLI